MKIPDDAPSQVSNSVGLLATIFAALGLAGAWLWKRFTGGEEDKSPMKAEVIPQAGKLIVEIPITEVLDRQNEVLAKIEERSDENARALGRIEADMKNLDRRAAEGQVWATDVQRTLVDHGERIARLEGKVRRFHDGGDD